MSAAPAPFGLKRALALVAAGTLLFLALIWALGSGGSFGTGGLDNAGGHAASTGLNGYAGLSRVLAADGWQVELARSDTALRQPGLLVLTPPADAKGKDIDAIVAAHRRLGPTLVITPKWLGEKPKGKAIFDPHPGWVQIKGTQPPSWQGFLDDVTVTLGQQSGRWTSKTRTGSLPDRRTVLSGQGERLAPLVESTQVDAILAAAIIDEGYTPSLEAWTIKEGTAREDDDTSLYPLVLVFEPDLVDNYGLHDPENVALAEDLARALQPTGPRHVVFDLTLNGLALPDNLLRLAITPPYLAATLCLILAALAVGWRAFIRFGPALAQGRDVAFGKAVLVAHAGALIVRSGRMRLLAGPYAAQVRERVARGLALARTLDAEAADAAIDRALQARDGAAPPFSETARSLSAATRPGAVVAAARQLHDSARKLMR